jgi:hypothetical protein
MEVFSVKKQRKRLRRSGIFCTFAAVKNYSFKWQESNEEHH